MDDLISRQAAIDAADYTDYTGLAIEDVKKVTDGVVKELKKLPSAQPDLDTSLYTDGFNDGYKQAQMDARRIIRCKDCKHYANIRRTNRFWCNTDNGVGWENPEPDDFCSRAERKEE